MPDSPDWYEVTQGSELLQGDLLRDCPIPRVRGLEHWPLRAGQPLEVDIDREDVIIVSQSCDLANDKIDDVVLAQVLDWAVACRELIRQGNTFARSRNFRRALVAGNIPSLSLLHKHDRVPMLGWSIVDFHRLFVLPKPVVLAVARAAGPRLRLRSPYREHVAQALARYFMRAAAQTGVPSRPVVREPRLPASALCQRLTAPVRAAQGCCPDRPRL